MLCTIAYYTRWNSLLNMVRSIEYSWTVWPEWHLTFETDKNVQHTCLVFQKYINYFLWLFYLWPFVRCQIHILCGTSFMECLHHIICHYFWYHTFAQKCCIVTFVVKWQLKYFQFTFLFVFLFCIEINESNIYFDIMAFHHKLVYDISLELLIVKKSKSFAV